MTSSELDNLPHGFLVDMLLLSVPLKRVSRNALKLEVCEPCNFHEHPNNRDSLIACKKSQLRDGAFYVSFLRACMSEVYALEDEAVAAEQAKLDAMRQEAIQPRETQNEENGTKEFEDANEADDTLLGDEREDKDPDQYSECAESSGSEASSSTVTTQSHFHSLTRTAKGTCLWLLQNGSGRR